MAEEQSESQDAERLAGAAEADQAVLEGQAGPGSDPTATESQATSAGGTDEIPAIVPGASDGVLSLEAGPTIVAPPPDYSVAGVPSLDFVRDKIEGRYARSLGSTELAEETPEARSFQEQAAKREEAAQEKLAAIRRSLRDGPSS